MSDVAFPAQNPGPMSPELRRVLDTAGSGLIPPDRALPLIDEASRHLAWIRSRMSPADERSMFLWMCRLAPMVVNPPATEDAIRASANALIEICGSIPGIAWSRHSREAWVQQGRDASGNLPGKFWPCPAELYELLSNRAAEIRQIAIVLDRIVNAEAEDAYDKALRDWGTQAAHGPRPRREQFLGRGCAS